jgi:hypothetical protein
MPTLREVFAELYARQARLDNDIREGFGSCIPGSRDCVNEMRWTIGHMLLRNMDALIVAAGDLDLGDLPAGVSLAYSNRPGNGDGGSAGPPPR